MIRLLLDEPNCSLVLAAFLGIVEVEAQLMSELA
jgi:hypothetical protein